MTSKTFATEAEAQTLIDSLMDDGYIITGVDYDAMTIAYEDPGDARRTEIKEKRAAAAKQAEELRRKAEEDTPEEEEPDPYDGIPEKLAPHVAPGYVALFRADKDFEVRDTEETFTFFEDDDRFITQRGYVLKQRGPTTFVPTSRPDPLHWPAIRVYYRRDEDDDFTFPLEDNEKSKSKSKPVTEIDVANISYKIYAQGKDFEDIDEFTHRAKLQDCHVIPGFTIDVAGPRRFFPAPGVPVSEYPEGTVPALHVSKW